MERAKKSRLPDSIAWAVRRRGEDGEPFFVSMREFHDTVYRMPLDKIFSQ